jgi:hypothetical protein
MRAECHGVVLLCWADVSLNTPRIGAVAYLRSLRSSMGLLFRGNFLHQPYDLIPLR